LRFELCPSSDHLDNGDGWNTAKRDGWHGVQNKSASDGDEGHIAGERRDGDVRGSGNGSERHIRGCNEYGHGNDEFERRGRFSGIHSKYNGRIVYGDGYSFRSDGVGQLQSDEHGGSAGIDHGDERRRAKRGGRRAVYKSAGGNSVG